MESKRDNKEATKKSYFEDLNGEENDVKLNCAVNEVRKMKKVRQERLKPRDGFTKFWTFL